MIPRDECYQVTSASSPRHPWVDALLAALCAGVSLILWWFVFAWIVG
jgi:hypothetical protein